MSASTKPVASRWKGQSAQVLRRVLQLGSLLFVVYAAVGSIWRNFKLAHNSQRLVALMEGETWGDLYGWNESLLSTLGDSYEASLGFLGMHWSSHVFGMPIHDPVMVLGHIVRTGHVSIGLLAGAAIPVVLAVLLGKVFCSHLCPMRLLFEVGQMVRRGLIRVGVPLPALRHDGRYGGFVLLGGIGASFFAGPAVWAFLLPYVGLGVGAVIGITTGAVSGVVFVAVGWLLIDALAAPGFFCKSVCPTGFALEQLGRARIWSLLPVAGARPCPPSCTECERACPYGLSPKEETHAPACDNCGKCAVACPLSRLSRQVHAPRRGVRGGPIRRGAAKGVAVALVAAALFAPQLAEAHHNKGLPHYGYYENYPQVPTEEYIALQDGYEIGATIFNFQGYDDRSKSDTPNDVKIYLYVYDLNADTNYTQPLDVEIHRDGEVIASWLRHQVDEEAVYSTRETLPETGEYVLVARLDNGTELRLPFYVDLGTSTINWVIVLAIVVPVAVLFGLAVAGRKRRKRRRKPRPATAVTAMVFLLTLLLLLPSAFAQGDRDPPPRPGSAPASGAAAPSSQPGSMAGAPGSAPTSDPSTMSHYETDKGAVMVMRGIPVWLLLLGIAGILVLSFVGVELLGAGAGAGFRLNLIKYPKYYRILKSRWFQTVPQLIAVGLFALLIYAGLFGSRVQNITPVAVWTIWWAGLVFFIMLLGPVFCYACPWDGLTNLISRLRLAARVEPLSLGLPFPPWLKNVYPALVMFVVLTWLELGYGVTTNPRWTSYMGIGVAGMAIGGALLWDGKRFCHHFCPVGRISGIYANFAPVEIRAARPKVCAKCTTEDCLNGNEFGYPCPTGISLKTVTDANYCTMCTECVKTCPRHNVALNLRPFAADLRNLPSGRTDEAWLALTLLSLTLFHGFSMTPAWENFGPGGSSLLKWMATTLGTPSTFNFTVAMIGVCAIPIALYWLSCLLGAAWAGRREVPASRLFVNFAFSILPVALFYHLAHNLMHLLGEGGAIIPLLGDPMGSGANYFGLAALHVGSPVSENTLWIMQVSLILIGHLYGIVVAHRMAHKLYADKPSAVRSLLPMLVMMVLISVAGLGLMAMDMNMRIGRM